MRSDETLHEVCEALQRNCGDLHGAAREAGISPHFLFTWLREDHEAAAKVQEAQRCGYSALESEAIRRAVTGVEEDVWYKGQVVGSKTSYSDALLTRLMEARIPEYSKKENNTTFNGPTQINIMPRAENYEQWLEMKTQTLAVRDDPPLLQQTIPEVLTGDYVEVLPNPFADIKL